MNKGLPRSGKTSWAKEFHAKSGNAVIVSRDDLREMLHLNKWSPRNEKVTIAAQKAIVAAMVKEGKVVIIDDTNLTPEHQARWEAFAREHNAGFEVKHHKESDLKTLIRRDMQSDTERGHHVIIRMALQHDYVHFKPDSVIICDIDGTIADCDHRRQYSHGPEKNWDKFFELAPQDTLIGDTRLMLHDFHDKGKTIIFVSARPERCRKDTEMWLLKHGLYNENVIVNPHLTPEAFGTEPVPYFGLLMRADGDSRDDVLTKQEILDKFLKKDWIHTVIDDRPKVINMWRGNGLEVIDVGKGIDF